MSQSPPTDLPSSEPASAEPRADEALMLRAARALRDIGGDDVFAELTRQAAALLGADIALLGRFVDDPGDARIRTLACCSDGEPVTAAEYRLAGTPCAAVVGQSFRYLTGDITCPCPAAAPQGHALKAYAGCPLTGDDGKPLGLLAVMFRQIAPGADHIEAVLSVFAGRAAAEIRRTEVETALRASEERYRSIFDASVDGLALLTMDGEIVDVNPAVERMYGYNRHEMIGQKALSFTRGSHRDKARQFLRTVEDRSFATMIDKAFHRDGSVFDIEPSGVVTEYRGEPHILAIVRDVTARVRAEAEHKQLEQQLRQAQKMEALGHLTGGVAHDFNNILTSVLGYIELAQTRVATQQDDQLDRYLDRARRSAGRARDLVGQMLTFSRGQPGEARPLAASAAVESSLGLLKTLLPANVSLRLELDAGVAPVVADPVHLEHILVSLCLNAVEAMTAGGELTLALSAGVETDVICSSCHQPVTGNFVALSVKDTGAGIAPVLQERVFEPFFTTKEVGEGSGMGLATVHGITHDLHGHIELESTPGSGTTVRVLLPVTGAPSAAG